LGIVGCRLKSFGDGEFPRLRDCSRMAHPGLIEETLTRSVIGAFYEVYNTLGFGFLEQVYAAALARELVARGHRVARECSVYVMYKGDEVATQRIDMIVDGKLVVEIKSTWRHNPVATRQLYNYLRGTSLEVGLLLHFGPEPAFYRLVHTNTHKQKDP
jgi:GxxExxY protein